ncbi:hypothetical protein JCM10207_008909 [Rhodosporidiobolus poonsookiae]
MYSSDRRSIPSNTRNLAHQHKTAPSLPSHRFGAMFGGERVVLLGPDPDETGPGTSRGGRGAGEDSADSQPERKKPKTETKPEDFADTLMHDASSPRPRPQPAFLPHFSTPLHFSGLTTLYLYPLPSTLSRTATLNLLAPFFPHSLEMVRESGNDQGRHTSDVSSKASGTLRVTFDHDEAEELAAALKRATRSHRSDRTSAPTPSVHPKAPILPPNLGALPASPGPDAPPRRPPPFPAVVKPAEDVKSMGRQRCAKDKQQDDEVKALLVGRTMAKGVERLTL